MAPGDRAYHSPAPAKGEKSDEGDQFNSVTNPDKTRAAKNTPSVREAYICQLCSFFLDALASLESVIPVMGTQFFGSMALKPSTYKF